ncbi:DUF3833 domain-containing protein [Parasulfitobacter algicola]|uniref:DUF3833 domain-containing protein n=1 Tax=Parasulfitobacter algicola TaxID=2614809 RepID=A0ABX2IUZ1_9RHOB|nr:DUF3833 domain-containing protein [Sulfitobacter algicola]NSX56718.1 DUF3833 domain-containing protein [Sulfitobacter algicola]
MDALLYILIGVAVTVTAMALIKKYAGFQAQSPEDYDGKGPQLDLRQHLNGPIVCEGVIYGPTGRVSSRFVGDFHANWNGNVGTMTEVFRYDSGTTQEREWKLRLGNDGSVKAEAADVIGIGTGMQKGPALQLNYRIKLPEDSGGHVLDTVDWMYLVENGSIINRSQFRKYGIKVAELVATMRPKDAA